MQDKVEQFEIYQKEGSKSQERSTQNDRSSEMGSLSKKESILGENY